MDITFYGASDDLVEVAGCAGADEFYVASTPSGAVCWHGDLVAPLATEQMRVSAFIGEDGCWHLALGQPLESVPFPAWPASFRQGTQHEAEYSVVLTVSAPEGTRLVNVWPGKDES
jgi:hypothetical protein